MADHLASIYGTEKDKVNCSFYFKIGACRHGDRCSRKHIKPNFSQTMVIMNAYQNPGHSAACTLSKDELQEHLDKFFEDMMIGLSQYGEIEELNICDNVGEHLAGNVYVRYKYEEDAGKAVEGVNSRFYDGRPLWAELSPVTDFSEACCRQFELSECNRGGFCNFMHVKQPQKQLKRDLYDGQRKSLKILKPRGEESEERSKARSRSPGSRRERRRSRDRRERSRDRDRDRDSRRRRDDHDSRSRRPRGE